jgi:U2-associated protein SR140
VADIIVASLLVDATPVPRKVARLHLICDILHNSAASVPSAWKFRQEFQSRLGLVFDHLSSIYHSFPGRITAETFKSQISGVVDVWEDWIVFPPEFTGSLRARLDGVSSAEHQGTESAGTVLPTPSDPGVPTLSKFKSTSFTPTTAEDRTVHSEVDGEPMDDEGESLDGEPLDGESLDGETMDMEPTTGESIDHDVDGEPMDASDVDGEPI